MEQEKRNKKVKYPLILFMLFIGYLILTSPTGREGAKKILGNHLKKKYNEEFVITNLGQRSSGAKSWYEASISPKSYIGTPREYDSYYKAKGFVTEGVGGDNFGIVIYKESINDYFKPKLQEIFGENVLPIFNSEVFLKSEPKYEDVKKNESEAALDGAIYIFGTIKDEGDIKRYQRGIFDFVQYLKEIDSFDRSKIAFIVIDERVLEDDFYDLGIKYKLMVAKEESKTEQEFLAKREKILSQIKITNTDKSERIDSINRGELGKGAFLYYGYNTLGVTHIVSPKMMKAGYYENLYKEEVGKTYDKLEEINMESFR